MPDYKTKIKDEESTRLRMYQCSEGKWTIGTGHNIEDNGISPAVSDLMLEEDLHVSSADATSLVSNFKNLPDNVKIVLVDMAFQMGKGSLSGFKKMIQAVEIKAFDVAASELLDSLYARQTPARANRNAELMRTSS